MADDDFNHVSVQDMETLICQLPSVLRCAVTVTDWGAVEEIHVLATTDRSPKQIVRDVESALLARWNLRVDHKRISVAQIVDEENGPTVRQPARLTIVEYHMDIDSIQHLATTRVILKWSDAVDDQTYTGHWSGRYLGTQYYHVMAWAAVDALNQLPELPRPLVLLDLKTLILAERTVVAVALGQPGTRRQTTVLIGAAEERGDGQGASVRAVLDAVNRRISRV
ncbi:hypothetical protein Sulac_1640 [Sulfobacillus acidophilus DSM 10332]|uniref:Uncharacterized protein n=1 Tax=Sulfobacillus acidophilus (strain ATCC 700253 / DSM 10332 / NAL) TaxID=679936 RepID=G8TYV8_SULAD|nr:hypothetical protein Sulac_1640 [Sulfobacillus acidophilus DSM 10332]